MLAHDLARILLAGPNVSVHTLEGEGITSAMLTYQTLSNGIKDPFGDFVTLVRIDGIGLHPVMTEDGPNDSVDVDIYCRKSNLDRNHRHLQDVQDGLALKTLGED